MMGLRGIVNILDLSGRSIGTGFFVSSEGYLLTCNHVLDAAGYNVGQTVSFKYSNSSTGYQANCIEKNKKMDLALLQTDEKAADYIPLYDRDNSNLMADSYGFPNGSYKRVKVSVHIDEVTENGKELQLGNANSVTFGFSGAPLIHNNAAIGMIKSVTKEDAIGRMINVAFAATAKCILQAFAQYLNNDMLSRSQSVLRYTEKELVCPITLSQFGLLANTYVERTELLNRMKSILENPMHKKNYVYLSGIGGEGKSELARAYAYREKDNYQEIFWLTYEDDRPMDITELFDSSRHMRTPISMEKVKQLDEKNMIIIDNCNHLTGKFLREIMSGTGKAKLIFTTRMAVIEADSNYEEHMLRVVSDNQEEFALEVFRRNLKSREISSDEIYAVKRICRKVGYHPMAVSMLARDLFVHRKNCPFADFDSELEKGFTVVFPQYVQLPFCKDESEDNKSFYSVLKTLFKDFLSYDFSLLELQVLSLLFLMPFKEYKKEYIFALLGDDILNSAIEAVCISLLSRGWLLANGEYLCLHPLIAEAGRMKGNDGKREMRVIEDTSFYIYLLKNWLVMLPEIADEYFDIMIVCLSKIENAAETESENNFLYQSVKEILNHYKIMNVLQLLDERDAAEILAKRQRDITQAPGFIHTLRKLRKIKFHNAYPTLSFGLTAVIEYKYGIDYMYYDLESHQECLILSLSSRKICRGYWGMENLENQAYVVPLKVHLKQFIYAGAKNCHGDRHETESFDDLDFPDGLLYCDITEIPSGFCKGCSIKTLELPDNLSVIGESAFEECRNLEGEIRFPKSMDKIGKRAFFDCSNITEVFLPDGITEISDDVFSGCSRLTTIKWPLYLKSIGENAFRGCAFKEIALPWALSVVRENAFASCSYLENVDIPESVVSIGRGAFRRCPFQRIEIPVTVTDFSEINFEYCSNLVSFTVPERVTDIRYFNFNFCEKLGYFSFPKGIEYSRVFYIGFERCSAITKLELPEGLEQINGNSFKYCTNLEEIVIPDTVRSIGRDAFWGCCKLKMVKLPAKLQQIDNRVFAQCTSLETISIPSTITSFNWEAIPDNDIFQHYNPQHYVYFPDGANKEIFNSLKRRKLWLCVIELTHLPETFPENTWEALCRGYLLAVKKNFQIPEDIKNAYERLLELMNIEAKP